MPDSWVLLHQRRPRVLGRPITAEVLPGTEGARKEGQAGPEQGTGRGGA